MTRPFVHDPLTVTAPGREPAPPQHEPRPATISAVSMFNVVLRYRVMILFLSLLFGFWAGFKSVTSGKSYTAQSQFMPKGARGQSQLSGIAAQFGVQLGGGDAMQSPQFYVDLMETKGLLLPVAQKQYSIHTDSGVISGDLLKLYNIKPDRRVVMNVKVVEALARQIKSEVAPKTGVITLTVATGNPELSLQVARNVLEQVNVSNLATRQRQATAERSFAERQVGEKRAELRQAEAELASFLESNRLYRQSPQLTLEYNRLQREVDRRNLVYSSLLSAYETARIEEVKDLPVITVIEPPDLPIVADRRGGVRKTAIGLLIGLILGCLIAFARDRMARNRESQTDEFLEYAALKREAIGDLTHPWRPITRALGSRRRA